MRARGVLAAAAWLLLPRFAAAQAAADDRTELSVQVGRPWYDDGFADVDLTSGSVVVRARQRLGDELTLVGEASWGRFGYTFTFDESFGFQGDPGEVVEGVGRFDDRGRLKVAHSSSATANPYLGGRWQLDARTSMEVGVWLPVLGEDLDALAAAAGAFPADGIDRHEAYLAETTSFTAIVERRMRTAEGQYLRLRGGPSWLVHSGQGLFHRSPDAPATGQGEHELTLHYGADLTVPLGPGSLQAGLSGLAAVSEGDMNLAEHTLHEVRLQAGLDEQGWQPSLTVRVPLDEEFRDVYRIAVGVSVGRSWR